MEQQIDVQPHDIQAEQAVLGAMLIDPDAILGIREQVHPRDFYVGANRDLYGAYLAAVDGGNDAPDYVTLCNVLERQGKLEDVGGKEYIIGLANKTPTAMNAMHYAGIVAQTGYLRRAIATAQRIAQIAYANNAESVDAKQEQIERLVFDLAPVREGEGLEHISVTVGAVYDEMDRRHEGDLPPGVKTGFSRLDKMTGGLQKSDLIIVAARPSMGKTALMLDIARNASMIHHKNVAFFSLEMSKTQLVQRLIASRSDINSTTLRSGRLNDASWPVFINTTGELGNAGIYIDDRGGQSTSRMRAGLRRLLAKVEIDLVVIDYLQLMRTDRRTGGLYEKTAQLSKDAKGLAKEFNLPVVVGSQLSRACEKRDNKRPMLSDMRDSGTIEEDADAVMFIYRDEYYNANTDDIGIAEVNLAKHRNGETGILPLHFNKSSATFREIEIHAVEL